MGFLAVLNAPSFPTRQLQSLLRSSSRALVHSQIRNTFVHVHTRTHTVIPCQYRITRGRDFFITVRADCIFLRLSTTGVSNLENRVEGGPSNHVFLAIVSCVDPRHPRFSSGGHPFIPAPACPHPWTQSSSRENGEPFIRRP